LRERPQDVAVLAQHFARKYSEANGLPERTVGAQAMAMLQAHHFRGNVRELENTMHRAVLLSRGTEIGPEAILLTGAEPAAAKPAPAVAPVAARVAAAAPAAPSAAMPQPGDATAAGTAALVGRTVADVERDLIIDTLSHCLGNRTHAANILGISIRTLRNKLKQYSDEGVAVPPPAGGDYDRAAV